MQGQTEKYRIISINEHGLNKPLKLLFAFYQSTMLESCYTYLQKNSLMQIIKVQNLFHIRTNKRFMLDKPSALT